jgi:hypothetical protein
MEFGMLTDTVIEIPDSLPYPELLDIKSVQPLFGRLCYIIKYYEPGVALTIARGNDNVCITPADWLGKALPPDNQILTSIMMDHGRRVLYTLKLIGVNKAQIFFSNDMRLVDIRLSINKFCGPGYINDFFGKQGIPVQECIGEPILLDDDSMQKLIEGSGIYDTNIIIKPSTFKFMIKDNGDVIPIYGVIRRDSKRSEITNS